MFAVLVTFALPGSLVVVPGGVAQACRIIVGDDYVNASELATVLEADGEWAQRTGADATSPPFVAAGQQQLVDLVPANEVSTAGETWKMRAAWGPATIRQVLAVEPSVKAEMNYCYLSTDVSVGDNSYWLEDDAGVFTEIRPGTIDDGRIERELTALFGAPVAVTDEMIVASQTAEPTTQLSLHDRVAVGRAIVTAATRALVTLLAGASE